MMSLSETEAGTVSKGCERAAKAYSGHIARCAPVCFHDVMPKPCQDNLIGFATVRGNQVGRPRLIGGPIPSKATLRKARRLKAFHGSLVSAWAGNLGY